MAPFLQGGVHIRSRFVQLQLLHHRADGIQRKEKAVFRKARANAHQKDCRAGGKLLQAQPGGQVVASELSGWLTMMYPLFCTLARGSVRMKLSTVLGSVYMFF